MSHNSLISDTSCKLYLKLDDDAASDVVVDYAPHGSGNATLLNAVQTTDWSVAGPSSYLPNALQFNYDLGSRGITTALVDDTFTDDWSAVGWCWWDASANQFGRLVSFDGDPEVSVNPAPGQVALGGYVTGTTRVIIGSSAIDSRDAWSHHGYTFDLVAKEVRGYKDGSFAGLATLTSPESPAQLSGNTTVGCYQLGGPNNTWGGRLAGVALFDRVITEAEYQEIYAGPEPTYDSGAALDSLGAYDLGSWNDPSNGALAYAARAVDNAGNVVGLAAGSSGVLALAPGLNYLEARVSNDGGYDVGDSPVGGSPDGWYRLGSVTAAALHSVLNNGIIRS